MTMAKNLTILIVEDDEGHATLIRMNLRDAGIDNELVHVTDGQAALDYVAARYQSSRPDPLLILLDLNLPEVDGFGVLKSLKSDAETRRIPVIILTSTDDKREITRCYELGCNIFLRKPVDYASFVHAIKQLGLFLSVVEIPGLP
jgi:CheY-like chemotaxis protein